MNSNKLTKLRGELAALRRKTTNARGYEALAAALGRKKNDRGKHPMWMSERFDLPPLSIPHHGGKDIAKPTAKSILDQLEDDIMAWDEYLKEWEDGEDE